MGWFVEGWLPNLSLASGLGDLEGCVSLVCCSDLVLTRTNNHPYNPYSDLTSKQNKKKGEFIDLLLINHQSSFINHNNSYIYVIILISYAFLPEKYLFLKPLTSPCSSYKSSHETPICPLRPLSQDILLQLSCTRFRQLIHNFHLPRHHKPADPTLIFRPFNNICPTDLLFPLHRDECLGSFPPMRVCYRHHCCLEDVWMGSQHTF